MFNAKFQTFCIQGGTVTLVPHSKWIGFVYIQPKDHTLNLAQDLAFELFGNRHWRHRYQVAKIKADGVTLNFRDECHSFFPYRSLKLTWK
ncbi:hypothetical protein IAD21_00024 [Abditibacteriota bacterium]|nr:hypothetical protein IAD21_00024 [Abditibacteriota bacterium]